MATTTASPPTTSTKSGLFRSLTSKLVRKDEDAGETKLRPHRAGTLRTKAREQMLTGRARPPSLTIGDDGWGSDGKLYVKNLDHDHPPSSFNHHPSSSSSSPTAPSHGESQEHHHHHHHHHDNPSSSSATNSPTSSSIRPVQQRDLSAPSPYSLPLGSNPSSTSSSSSPSREQQQPPSDAFRSPSRPFNQQQQQQDHAHFAPSSTSQAARSHSHSHSQPSPSHHTYSRSSSDAPPPPPLPSSSNGFALTESYAPSSIPRSKSGPNQRAAPETTDSGGYQPRPRNLVDQQPGGGSARTPASASASTEGGAGAGAGKEGWAKVKRGMTLVRKGGREARAQEQAQQDPNRPPSPLRKAAAPKMYSPAELAMEIEKAEKAAAEQAAAAYRASSMVPRKTKQEAAEETRLTESAFY